jgi:hypothetical protein
MVLGLLAVLIYFHIRRRRADQSEWPRDTQELDDYGFDVNNQGVARPRAAYQKPRVDNDDDGKQRPPVSQTTLPHRPRNATPLRRNSSDSTRLNDSPPHTKPKDLV